MIRSLAVVLIASAPLARGQGTYTQIDYPGAVATAAYGIDTAGELSGSYADSSGNVHGFLLSGVTYTAIDYPGSSVTQLFGLNDEGQIVGFNGSSVGFVYDIQTQAFTEISYPKATYTIPTAVNNAGDIAGYYEAGNGSGFGFKLAGSKYTQISPPGTLNAAVFGITTSGEVVGYAAAKTTNKDVNFLFKPGKYELILRPIGGNPLAHGINGSGDAIVGEYEPSGTGEGFLYQNGTAQPLQFPGATATAATSINSDGEVAGYFLDSSSHYHGFTWTPPADASKK
jgi:hypothetical protein